MSEIQIALTPVHLGLFFGGLACVFAFFLRRRREGIRMARYLVENQHRAASDAELDAYLNLAQADGKRDAFLRELVHIRRAYGHANVKLGHLTWIDQKLSGHLPPDAVAPAFSGPYRNSGKVQLR